MLNSNKFMLFFNNAVDQFAYHFYAVKLKGKIEPKFIAGTRELIQYHEGKTIVLNGFYTEGAYDTSNIEIDTIHALTQLMLVCEDPLLLEKYCNLVFSIIDNNRKLYNVEGDIILDFNEFSPVMRQVYKNLLVSANRCGLREAGRQLNRLTILDKVLCFFAKSMPKIAPPKIELLSQIVPS